MKIIQPCIAASIFVFFASACSAAGTVPPLSPQVQTVVITQVATQVETVEVTRVMEIPVTSTPTPSATPTPTPYFSPTPYRIPSSTPTFTPPDVSVLADSGCYYGPSSAYLLKYGLFALNWMTVVGRNPDGTWLNVKSQNDPLWNACWIRTDQVHFYHGSLADVPIVWMTYPFSILYGPPTRVSANRVGNEVTVFWHPVYMTEDDYRGYLIEAWVCLGGKQVFHPVSYVTSFATNDSMLAEDSSLMAVAITDEPGCDIPSNARLYGVEKHGYTAYQMINWPGFSTTPTP